MMGKTYRRSPEGYFDLQVELNKLLFYFAERLAGRLPWSVQEESEAVCEKEPGSSLIVQHTFAISKQSP